MDKLTHQTDCPAFEKVTMRTGLRWFSDAFRLFWRFKRKWMTLAFIYLFISNLPLNPALLPEADGPRIAVFAVTSVISYWLHLYMVAGIMYNCRQIHSGNRFQFKHLTAAAAKNRDFFILLLITLPVFAVFAALCTLWFFLYFFSAIIPIYPLFSVTIDESILPTGIVLTIAAIIVFCLYHAVCWLAPALVLIENMKPWPAVKTAVRAYFSNFSAFFIHGLVWFAVLSVFFLAASASFFYVLDSMSNVLPIILYIIAIAQLTVFFLAAALLCSYSCFQSIWPPKD